MEREGEYISEQRSKKAKEILERHGFDAFGKRVPGDKGYASGNEYTTLAEESPSKIREDLPSAEEKGMKMHEGLGGERESSCITEELIKKAIEELNVEKEKEL